MNTPELFGHTDSQILTDLLEAHALAIQSRTFSVLGQLLEPSFCVTSAFRLRQALIARRQLTNSQWVETVRVGFAEGRAEAFPLVMSPKEAEIWLVERSFVAPNNRCYHKVYFEIHNLVPGIHYTKGQLNLHHPRHGQDTGDSFPNLKTHCFQNLDTPEDPIEAAIVAGVLACLH